MPSRIRSIRIIFTSQDGQRYPTVGDWQIHDDDDWPLLEITVTEQPDQLMSWPIVIHELAEALLCHAEGITTKQVDDWDIHGGGKGHPDPGALPDAPYFVEHMQACKLEELMVEYLDLDPEAYADALAMGDTHDDVE